MDKQQKQAFVKAAMFEESLLAVVLQSVTNTIENDPDVRDAHSGLDVRIATRVILALQAPRATSTKQQVPA